jgi:hypothetical protein
MIDEDFSQIDRINLLFQTMPWAINDNLEHEIMVLKERIAELERQLQNSPDYRTLIRFPTAECSVL